MKLVFHGKRIFFREKPLKSIIFKKITLKVSIQGTSAVIFQKKRDL